MLRTVRPAAILESAARPLPPQLHRAALAHRERACASRQDRRATGASEHRGIGLQGTSNVHPARRTLTLSGHASGIVRPLERTNRIDRDGDGGEVTWSAAGEDALGAGAGAGVGAGTVAEDQLDAIVAELAIHRQEIRRQPLE